MHNLQDERYTVNPEHILSSDLNSRECCCCFRIQALEHFRRDTSSRDGRAERCIECENTPWMTIDENTEMLREKNYNSEANKRRRPPYIDSMKCDIGRIGRVMDALSFLNKLKTLLPGLRWYSGRIEGDFAVYIEDRFNQDGVKYLWYVPQGVMPEFSLHEFDRFDCPVKEKKRGWRTPLLRCILGGMITEEEANRVFGSPTEGLASQVYRTKLWEHRNKK